MIEQYGEERTVLSVPNGSGALFVLLFRKHVRFFAYDCTHFERKIRIHRSETDVVVRIFLSLNQI